MQSNETMPLHDEACERDLLGALLAPEFANAADLIIVYSELEARHFRSPSHRAIFAACLELHSTSRPIDEILVAEYLRAHGDFERVGGYAYLAQLTADSPTATNVVYRARRIRELAERRSLAEKAQRIIQAASDPQTTVAEALDLTERFGEVNAESRRHTLGGCLRTVGDDWFATEPPPRKYLLETILEETKRTLSEPTGFMPLGRVAFLVGAGASGKSWALIQLALSVATGAQWLGAYNVTREGLGRVLLALGEEEEHEIRRRLYHASRLMGLTAEQKKLAEKNIVIAPLAGVPVALVHGTDEMRALQRDGKLNSNDLAQLETPFARELRRTLEAPGDEWRLIVADPISRFAGPDAEVSNAAATRFVEALERLTHVPGNPTVIASHHSNKASRDSGKPNDGGTSARGSSALTDGARFCLELTSLWRLPGCEHLPPLAKLRTFKNNYGSYPDDLWIARVASHEGALRRATKTEVVAYETAEKAKESDQRSAKRPMIHR